MHTATDDKRVGQLQAAEVCYREVRPSHCSAINLCKMCSETAARGHLFHPYAEMVEKQEESLKLASQQLS